jgi:acyl-coenzyme A synthetase/AMP-(fatty) acid ligase
MVKRDLEGFLYFLGRKDHLIKTSGYRVSPTEVENIALEVPGIIEAVAVGVPDDVLGQRITLAVIADDQQTSGILAAVRQYCRQHLPAFMVPARILVLASIPRTPNGKHDRAGLQLLLQEIHEDAEEQIG